MPSGFILFPAACFVQFLICKHLELQCYDAVGWRQEGLPACKTEWWDAGVVICLGRGADLHMAQLIA